MDRINIKFDRPMWPNKKTSAVVFYDDITNPITILGRNFGVDERFCTKFGIMMENRQTNGTRSSEVRFSKIQDGERPPSWISILGHNFGVDQHFYMFSLLDQPRRVLHSG